MFAHYFYWMFSQRSRKCWSGPPTLLYKSAAAESAAEETGSFDFTRWRKGGKGLVRSPFFMFSLCKGGQSIPALFAQSWGGRADLLYGHSSQDEEFLRQERENPREDGHAQNTERWGGGMKTLDEGGGESLREGGEEPHALTVGGGGE